MLQHCGKCSRSVLLYLIDAVDSCRTLTYITRKTTGGCTGTQHTEAEVHWYTTHKSTGARVYTTHISTGELLHR